MSILTYIIWIFLTVFFWFLVLRLINNNKFNFYLIEFIIYSFFLWVFLESFLCFIIWWTWLTINIISILIWNWLFLIFFFLLNLFLKVKQDFKEINFINKFLKLDIYTKLLVSFALFWLLFKLIIWFVSVVNLPTYQDDSFHNWNMRAKVFYERESLVLDNNDEDFLWRGYKQYPLTPSIYKTFLMNFSWKWTEWNANFPWFLYYTLWILLMFFVIFRKTESIWFSFLWVYLLSSIPLYYIHWTNPYSDVMMSIYFFIAVYFLYLFVSWKVNILYPILFIWILGYIKSEWLIIFTTSILLSLLVLLIIKKHFNKENIINYLKIFSGVLVVNLPFILFKTVYSLWFWNWDASIADTSLTLHFEIFYPLYQALFHTGAYNILPFFFIILIVTWFYKYKKFNKDSFIFFLSLFISFSIIIFIYFTTFTFQYVIDQTWINRSMMQIMYIFIFVFILFLYDIVTNDWKN